jgi:peptide-methionine (R)-S-oxide reductase
MTEHQVDDAELRDRLTSEQYVVTQQAGTERAFTGQYWDTTDDGIYRCIVCDEPLFESDTKYDAGCGWPSFYQAIDEDKITRKVDMALGMQRIETECAKCGAHLGHVFPDGPQPTGERFCMNSASLNLEPPAED